jgi:hypothetical protein
MMIGLSMMIIVSPIDSIVDRKKIRSEAHVALQNYTFSHFQIVIRSPDAPATVPPAQQAVPEVDPAQEVTTNNSVQEKTDAATKLQAVYRGNATRESLRLTEKSVVVIQSHYRARRARNMVKVMRESQQQDEASSKEAENESGEGRETNISAL